MGLKTQPMTSGKRGNNSICMGVSENSGTLKSSILIGFSIINHPFWGTTIFGNPHILAGSYPNEGMQKHDLLIYT